MQRSDSGLQRERSRAGVECMFDEWQRFGDLSAIPQATILLLQNYQIAFDIETCIATGIVEKHERQQSGEFRGCGLRHESFYQPGEADGFHAEFAAHQRFTLR